MKVLVALPSVGRLIGINVVNSLRETLARHGHTPVFYFGINRQDATQEFKREAAKHLDVRLALVAKRGQGTGTLAAIKMGLREKPDAILTLPDDYELEAKHMHKL